MRIILKNDNGFYLTGENCNIDTYTKLAGLPIIGNASILNPDVCQLITPAGLRAEHPVATFVSNYLNRDFDFSDIRYMAEALHLIKGAFCVCVLNKYKNKAALIAHNCSIDLNELNNNEIQISTINVKPTFQSKIFLFGINNSQSKIEYLETEIEKESSKRKAKLFIIQTHADLDQEWVLPYIKIKDTIISYNQLRYGINNYTNIHRKFFELTTAAIEFIEKLVVPHTSIVFGIKPSDCTLNTVSTMTRMTYLMTNGRVMLEAPLYEEAIKGNIISQY